MGVLYRAIDDDLHRDVAIKVLTTTRLSEPGARERFAREARAAASLKHPNIVTIYEFKDGTPPYLVMEFLEGCDLDRRLLEGPPLTLDRALDIVVQLCAALGCAHGQGIVHRDVKPANIWLQPDGLVRLLDFGIAKLAGRHDTSAGEALGSTPYMAPEQLHGVEIDGRADIFSTGVVLYQLLSMQRPFDGDSPAEVMLKIIKGHYTRLEHISPHLPETLAAVVARTLETDRQQRYQHVEELGEELRRIRQQLIAKPTEATIGVLGTLHVEPDEELAEQAALLTAMYPEESPASGPPGLQKLALVGVGIGVLAVAVQLSGWTASPPPLALAPQAATLVEKPTAVPAVPTMVAVRIESTPPGAAILINGRDIGSRTPASVNVDPSSPPEVQLSKDGYRHKAERLTPAQLTAGALIGRMEAVPTRVVLSASGPFPFEVVDGTTVLSSANTRHELGLIAPRTVRLRAADYLLNHAIALEPSVKRRDVRIPRPGRLTVRAGETCRITVDGFDLGQPPVNSRPIAAGSHTLQALCPEVSRRVVVITSGELHREVFQ